MADALDSKSSGRKAVWVRLPPPAPTLSCNIFLVHSFIRSVHLCCRLKIRCGSSTVVQIQDFTSLQVLNRLAIRARASPKGIQPFTPFVC
jgi:hypothetical protein